MVVAANSDAFALTQESAETRDLLRPSELIRPPASANSYCEWTAGIAWRPARAIRANFHRLIKTNGIQIKASLRSRLTSGSIIPSKIHDLWIAPESPIMNDITASRETHIDGESSHQRCRWELEHGANIDETQTMPGSHREPGQSLPLDQIGMPDAAFAWDYHLRIAGHDFVSHARRFRPLLILGTLCGTALSLGLIGGFSVSGLHSGSDDHCA
jgi:hypothetical protein